VTNDVTFIGEAVISQDNYDNASISNFEAWQPWLLIPDGGLKNQKSARQHDAQLRSILASVLSSDTELNMGRRAGWLVHH